MIYFRSSLSAEREAQIRSLVGTIFGFVPQPQCGSNDFLPNGTRPYVHSLVPARKLKLLRLVVPMMAPPRVLYASQRRSVVGGVENAVEDFQNLDSFRVT
jgi:hypothetical protein